MLTKQSARKLAGRVHHSTRLHLQDEVEALLSGEQGCLSVSGPVGLLYLVTSYIELVSKAPVDQLSGSSVGVTGSHELTRAQHMRSSALDRIKLNQNVAKTGHWMW